MTEHEAIELVENWIREHSRFAATVVGITSSVHGTWVALVECSTVLWEQTVSPEGEVGNPLIQ